MQPNKWFSVADSSLGIRAFTGRIEKSCIIISLMCCLLLSSVPAYSAVFNIPSGDVTALIAAINTANTNGEENTINLGPGTYILTSVDNSPSPLGGNGLPVISGTMTINGESAETTIIERNLAAPRFRIFAARGKLTLSRLTITGGRADSAAGIANGGTLTITDSIIDRNGDSINFRGGGISNGGTLTILRSIITNNLALFDGGGIFNSGTATITSSSISRNFSEAAGGVQNGSREIPAGTVTIQNSTISDNRGDSVGGILNGPMGTMIISNSTVANNINRTPFFPPLLPLFPGGIDNFGALQINNSTVAGNVAGLLVPVLSGIRNVGALELQNTIVDRCSGPITSVGNNIIDDLSDCAISLLSSDLTGDPGLGAFVDDGAPGHGRFPLLTGSPAIDAGNDVACPPADQLGTARRGPCDIGAVEFYPLVNDLVALANVSTAFDPAPVPGGSAGTFRITAEFINTSTQAIVNPFAEVVELTEENLLLNANGGAGGVGARVTQPDSATTPFEPGASSSFEFLIGLQRPEPFTFFVNMLGDPQTSNRPVTMR